MDKNKKIKKTLYIIAAGVFVKVLGFIILTTFVTSLKNPPQNKKIEESAMFKIETLANSFKTIKNENQNIKS